REGDNRKAPPDNVLYHQDHSRREPCDSGSIHSLPRTSRPTPTIACRNISASLTTDPNAPPTPSGPSSATPPAASSPWPLPVPLSAMHPPTPPHTMPCWPPCRPTPHCNADSTVPCNVTCPKP